MTRAVRGGAILLAAAAAGALGACSSLLGIDSVGYGANDGGTANEGGTDGTAPPQDGATDGGGDASTLPADGGPLLLGDETLAHGTSDYLEVGAAEAFPTIARADGTLGRFYVFLALPAPALMLVAVYDDNGNGAPLDLLTSGKSASLVTGWNEVDLSPQVKVSAGARYWLALGCPQGNSTKLLFESSTGVGAGQSIKSSNTQLRAMDAVWPPGGNFSASAPVRAYVTD